MKIKTSLAGLLLLLISFCSCDDTLSSVGTTIQPESDRIHVYADTFQLKASTIKLDSIYAKTRKGTIGYLDDPKYGSIKSEYMCQFYCPEDFKFAHEPYKGKVDSADFRIFYTTYVGDSLTTMQIKLFQISKALDRNYYTNINPAQYCDMSKLLAEQTYTAYDMSVSDSIHNLAMGDANYHYPQVVFKLPTDFAQNFYEETINNREAFKNQETFNEFFPGVYVANPYGVGNILNVDNTRFSIYYKYVVESSTGKDSLASATEIFNVTKEVIQLNNMESAHTEELLKPNDQYTYLKTPAGVCTQISIPATAIMTYLKGRIINNCPFSLKAMPQEDWEFPLTPPRNLLLLPKDSASIFFKDEMTENNLTSYLSSDYNPSTRTYTFPNLAGLLKSYMESGIDNDLEMLVIPITRSTGQTSGYSGTQTYTTGISHYLYPSAVTLRKDKEAMRLAITSSKFED